MFHQFLLPSTPQEEARRSNMRHRPVGLGVQGAFFFFSDMWGYPVTVPKTNVTMENHHF